MTTIQEAAKVLIERWDNGEFVKAAAQTMDRVAAARGIHALDLNPDITAHNTLRRELIRAGAALAVGVPASHPLQAEPAMIDKLRGAIADIAFSDDMTLYIARSKAKRIYDETASADDAKGRG